MSEKTLCKISFEAWWVKTFYPHNPPTYDAAIDHSIESWFSWRAAWELRGELDSNCKTEKGKADVS